MEAAKMIVVGRREPIEKSVNRVGFLIDDSHNEVFGKLQFSSMPSSVIQSFIPYNKQHLLVDKDTLVTNELLLASEHENPTQVYIVFADMSSNAYLQTY